MSGHSKWAQIKRQKGAADVKRGAAFTKLSNAITIAVRQGGGIGDPDQNFRLRLAIEAAKAENMPKENIERAIVRATSKGEGNLEEVVYEGFGPDGASVIVEAATDNKNRTFGEIKNMFDKNNWRLGQPGSVAYQFKQLGRIILKKNNKSIDDMFLEAADAGAQDLEDAGEVVFVYTEPSALSQVSEKLVAKGYIIEKSELTKEAVTPVTLTPEEIEKAAAFLQKLEEMDDVQKIYSNIG